MSARPFSHGEEGQALIIVALTVTVLLGALALVVDWGYALLQRRAAQNEADSAALAVGKLLATSVIDDGSGPIFRPAVGTGALCAEAVRYRNLNERSAPSREVRLELELFFSQPGDFSSVSTTCAPTSNPSPLDLATTRFVRATATTTYHSFFSAITGTQRVTVSASARVRLAGVRPDENAPVLPLVRHFSRDEFLNGTPCGSSCVPDSTIVPLRFSPAGQNQAYGDFNGIVDLSRLSSRDGQDQFITTPDQRVVANRVPLAADPSCSAPPPPTFPGSWDLSGDGASMAQRRACSVPNWFYYGFGGRLQLDSRGEGRPSLPRRSVCQGLASDAYFGAMAPSCPPPSSRSSWGDWVETTTGSLDANTVAQFANLIRDKGRPMPASDRLIPGTSTKFGNGIVVHLFLWDCGQRFTPPETWPLISPRGDCSDPDAAIAPARVHLFTMIPVTFYEAQVTTSRVEGYWGAVYAPSGKCGDAVLMLRPPSVVNRECLRLNPFANTAFLVPDD